MHSPYNSKYNTGEKVFHGFTIWLETSKKKKKTVATWCAVMQINAKNDDNNIVQTYLLVIGFQREKKNPRAVVW